MTDEDPRDGFDWAACPHGLYRPEHDGASSQIARRPRRGARSIVAMVRILVASLLRSAIRSPGGPGGEPGSGRSVAQAAHRSEVEAAGAGTTTVKRGGRWPDPLLTPDPALFF